MRKCLFFLLVLVGMGSSSLAETFDVYIEVNEPNIEHEYRIYPGYGFDEKDVYIRDTIRINLPAATLSPGDVYRAHVHFNNNKVIKVVNLLGMPEIAMGRLWIQGSYYKYERTSWSEGGIFNDGQSALEILYSQDLVGTSRSGGLMGVKEESKHSRPGFHAPFVFRPYNGEVAEGSLLGDFILEFTVPTEFGKPEILPFERTHFSWNYIQIGADYHDIVRWGQSVPEDTHFLEIVSLKVEAINRLVQDVLSLNLQQGISNSLDQKLQSALQALEDINENNNIAAINTLNSFINAVEAQRGQKITESTADSLINIAQQIINMLIGE